MSPKLIKNKLLILGMIILVPQSLALKNDRLLTCTVHADQAVFYQKQHVAVFTGHVTALQGSSTITGNKVLLTFDQDNKKLIKIIDFGNPATYHTQLDQGKGLLEAEANIINYYPVKALVTLQKHAKIKQHKDSISGNYIKYDLNKQILAANENKTAHEKTIIIIHPKDLRS